MSTTARLPATGDTLAGVLAAVSEQRMAATVTTLAAEPFAGRRVGTAGGAAARAWLAQRLDDLGATVTFDAFTVRSVPEVYTVPAARWHDGIHARTLEFGREMALHLASADRPIVRRGGFAVAGAGDPTGRWVAVPPGMSLFNAYGHAEGSLGLLVAGNVDVDGWQYTVLAGPDPGPLPVLTLDPATHAQVRAAAGTGRGWFAADAPIRRLDVPATNIHARFRPAAAGRPDLLLTAHYDGVGDHPGLRQPAAADNGSGVAVVFEAGRVLAGALPAGSGLSVALLDGEEVGALGSAHHARQLRQAGATPWVVNVDGAGRLDETVAVEAGGPAHPLLAALDQAGRHTGLPLAAGPVASDNRRYATAGLAAVGLGAGMAGYHSPADTAARVDPATMAALARLVIATGWLVATTTATLAS
jgi:hypothetical protein